MNHGDVLGSVGNTPIVELKRVVPPGHARVLIKMESHNPTGSMKDRMALSVVDRAVRSGRLLPDGRLVEYSGGSTGTSLAFVCAAYGIDITVVTSDAFSIEKRDHMRALGADVIEIPSGDDGITKALIQSMMAKAAELSEEPNAFAADQFNNLDARAGYVSLAEEIWAQTDGETDVFVQAIGTGHCMAGVAGVLRTHNPRTRLVAIEPAESPLLSGGRPGSHGIEGIGAGFVPPQWDERFADAVVPISTSNAMDMARRLAREEALFGGTSAGANVIAAIREAGRLGPGHTVVTLMCDSGLKYLSTNLYSAS